MRLWLFAKPFNRRSNGMMNLKDLLETLSESVGAPFRAWSDPPKLDEDNLLILQWLMAHLVRRTGEGLLNLKGLLTVSPPRLKCLFGNEPVFEASLSCRIAPNSGTFCQNVAECGRKSRFFATDFVLNVVWQLVLKL